MTHLQKKDIMGSGAILTDVKVIEDGVQVKDIIIVGKDLWLRRIRIS
jgi:hypothetical protein